MRPGQAAPEFDGLREAGDLDAFASMRPGQAAPEFDLRGAWNNSIWHASMRPGQAAPEFSPRLLPARAAISGFNEAGAGCPGIQP